MPPWSAQAHSATDPGYCPRSSWSGFPSRDRDEKACAERGVMSGSAVMSGPTGEGCVRSAALGHSVMLDTADVEFIPAWISLQEADALFSCLLERLVLKQESIVIAG